MQGNAVFAGACARWTLGEMRTGGRVVEHDAIRMTRSVKRGRSHAERGIEELKALVLWWAEPTLLAPLGSGEEGVEVLDKGEEGEVVGGGRCWDTLACASG